MAARDESSFNDRAQKAERALRPYWLLLLVEGIVLTVLGFFAIAEPFFASIAVTIFFGWLLLIIGVVGLVSTFLARGAPGFWWSLLSAAVGIAAGAVLLAWPVSGTISLTLVLVAFFILEGVASIMFALDHRRAMPARWGWMLAAGVADLAVAAIILAGLPSAAFWALGLIVGINLIFGGVSLAVMALSARSGLPLRRA